MSNIQWKDRAISRRFENKKIKKRCKELIISRDFWKDKAIKRNKEITQLKQQVALIKKNVQKILDV